MIRGEQYLKAYPDTPVSRHRPEEVSAYLEEIGRKGSLKDWQFRQVVDALEALFYKVVGAPWAGSIGDIGRTPRVRWIPIMLPSRATYRYRRRAAATIVERLIRACARWG